MFVTLQVWEETEMGIINKYYTNHKYQCIHVCEGTGLCERLCACFCFCAFLGAYILFTDFFYEMK